MGRDEFVKAASKILGRRGERCFSDDGGSGWTSEASAARLSQHRQDFAAEARLVERLTAGGNCPDATTEWEEATAKNREWINRWKEI
jgi:hypothetical protein